MTWTQRLSEFLAPKEEASNDPAVMIAATFAAEKRLRKIATARAKRFRRYAKRWEKAWAKGDPSKVLAHRPRTHLYREQQVG